MRGQVSLEYLIIFAAFIGLLLAIMPLLSKAKETSKEIVVQSKIDALSRELSSACEEVLVSGSGAVSKIEKTINPEINISGENIELKTEEVQASSQWSSKCKLKENKSLLIISRNSS